MTTLPPSKCNRCREKRFWRWLQLFFFCATTFRLGDVCVCVLASPTARNNLANRDHRQHLTYLSVLNLKRKRFICCKVININGFNDLWCSLSFYSHSYSHKFYFVPRQTEPMRRARNACTLALKSKRTYRECIKRSKQTNKQTNKCTSKITTIAAFTCTEKIHSFRLKQRQTERTSTKWRLQCKIGIRKWCQTRE